METAIVVLDKCFIRPYLPTDAEAVAREADNLNVTKYMTLAFPSPYTAAAAEGWIEIASQLPLRNFAICKRDGTFVGGIGLKPGVDIQARAHEIGYWIGEAHWGQGLTTDVARAFTRWAFEEIPELQRVEARVFQDNKGSMRVLAKAGYTYEGTLRKIGYKFGKSFDLMVYSVLREEIAGLRESEKPAE